MSFTTQAAHVPKSFFNQISNLFKILIIAMLRVLGAQRSGSQYESKGGDSTIINYIYFKSLLFESKFISNFLLRMAANLKASIDLCAPHVEL